MATYVPGSEAYLPDIKPFTPDYKFLSAVLDVRQDKYNSNWQATNDVYNKVVYADMSRTDTNEQREQYVSNLAPSIEKISGMDLSLAQNAQAAKAVFAPFFEDKLIVKDMVKTANYKKQMGYADRLLASPSMDVRDQYWRDGVTALQYRMEDFINMDAEEAVDSRMYKYVPNVNLFKLSQKILAEQEPPLTMKMEVPSYNSNGSVNTDWIVTQKNGDLVTGPALQILRKTLASDERVRQAYQTKAYVLGRDFAAAGIKDGKFTSTEEGQSAWAQETLDRISENNELRLKDEVIELNDLQNINVRWGNFKESTGIIPGSDDDKAMKEQLSAYEATKLALENSRDIKTVINTPSNDLETTLNRAYQAFMMTTIDSDMKEAAQAFSMRGFESTKEINQYSMERVKQRNRREMESIRHANNKEISDAEIEAANPYDPLKEASRRAGEDITDPHSNEYPLNEEGDEISDTYDFASQQNKIYAKDVNISDSGDVGLIIRSLTALNPNGDVVNGVETNQWTINVNGEDVTGNQETLINALSDRDEGGNLIHKKDINRLFKERYDVITPVGKNGTAKLKKEYPNLNGEAWIGLRGDFFRSENKRNANSLLFETVKESHRATYNKTKLLSNDVNTTGLANAGMPDIIGDNGLLIKEADYVKLAIKLAEEHKLTNYDQSGLDAGTGEKDYMIPKVEYAGEPGDFGYGTGPGHKVWKDASGKEANEAEINEYWRKTGKHLLDRNTQERAYAIDERAVTAEAKQYYSKQYTAFNTSLLKEPNSKASYNALRSGEVDESGDIILNPIRDAHFNVKDTDMESAGRQYAADLINQHTASIALGEHPMFLPAGAEEEFLTNDPMAERIFDMWVSDVKNYATQPTTSNTLKGMPNAKIYYANTYGELDDANKSTAAFIVEPDNGWLKAKAANFSKEEGAAILKYADGFKMIFKQANDISPISKARSAPGSSVLHSQILSTENDTKTFNKVDSKGNPIAKITYIRNSKYSFTRNTSYYNYDGSTGNYTKSDLVSEHIEVKNKDFGILDYAESTQNKLILDKALSNSLEREKAEALNRGEQNKRK